MTKKKHEPQIKIDGTYTTLTVYDLNGKKHVFDIDSIYAISIVGSDKSYWLQYTYPDSKYTQEVPIDEIQFNILKNIIKDRS